MKKKNKQITRRSKSVKVLRLPRTYLESIYYSNLANNMVPLKDIKDPKDRAKLAGWGVGWGDNPWDK